MLGDLVGADTGPRQLDHRPDEVVELALLGGDADGQLAQPAQLLAEAHERMHDLDERRVPAPLPYGDRGPHDRAHLHLVDLGKEEAEPAGAEAEHGVRLVQSADPLAHALVLLLLERGQELVQRPVEQADRHGQPRHRLEDPLEVALLDREQALERGAAAVLVGGQDHLAHQAEPVGGREHVLRPAEPDPLRPELAGLGRVLGRVGVRAHLQPPDPVRPARGSRRSRR